VASFELVTYSETDLRDMASRFLTAEDVAGLTFPENMESIQVPAGALTSFKPEHDPAKLGFLNAIGIQTPSEWNVVMSGAYSEYHAEVATAFILANRLRDIEALIRWGIERPELAVELEAFSYELFDHRLDTLGLRRPDITGKHRHVEGRRRANGIPSNPEARVSFGELHQIMWLVLSGLYRRG
jgi:hypothetical protein